MPSNTGASESARMGNDAGAKPSLRHQTAKSLKPTDKAYTDNHGGALNNRNDGRLAPLKFSGSHQIHHGKNKVMEAADLVKYMSNLPCYLQHAENDAIRVKALNFGVLNWGHLERWNSKQKTETVGRTEVHSPSSSDFSTSSFSSFGSSTVSGRSDYETCSLTLRKQYPSSNFHLNSSNEEGHSQVLDEKHTKPNVAFNHLRTVPIKHQFTGRDCLDLKLKSEKSKESDSKVFLHRTNQAPGLGTSCSNLTAAAKGKMETSEDQSRASDVDRLTEVNRKSFSEDFLFSSPRVPRSCPLPCSSQGGECSAREIGSPVDVQGIEISSKLGRSIPNSGQTPSITSKGKDSARHYASASFDITQRDKGNACSRGKASSLRRILDPLLKHKVSNHLHFNVADETDSTSKPPSHVVLASTCGTRNLSKASPSSFMSPPVRRKQNSLSCLSLDKLGSLQDDRLAASSMHALLQVGCKNGLPLFTFTFNDTEILAATMRKVYFPGKNDFNCIYTFYSVHFVQKTSEGRVNQGSNSKTQEYQSNIIGRMKVTCCPKPTSRGSKDHVIMREFVLTNAGQRSVADEALDLPPNYELAAIVVEVPNETMDRLDSSRQNGYGHGKSDVALNKGLPLEENSCYEVENQQIGSSVKNLRFPRIVAILPSGLHGLPGADRVPSPLIDRWKFGGSCDCGGWDVGCALTILANRDKPSKLSCKAHCSLNNTHRVDLSIQGGDHENKHVFSLVAFKEGLYMVDFNASISLLQVFSICIAILHNGKPVKQSEVCNLLDGRMKTPTKVIGETPSTYAPDPPLSPVGRV
ncbi:hypothetical protein AAC387_Pa05g3862 [Persea americana]